MSKILYAYSLNKRWLFFLWMAFSMTVSTMRGSWNETAFALNCVQADSATFLGWSIVECPYKLSIALLLAGIFYRTIC